MNSIVPGSGSGGIEYRDKLIGFRLEIMQLFLLNQSGFSQQLQPERGFVGLLDDNPQFGQEFRARTCPETALSFAPTEVPDRDS